MTKVNVLIVGAGHYSTGSTVLSGKKTTDKDYGIFLPSILELESRGMIGKIAIAGRDGKKLKGLSKKIKSISKDLGSSSDIEFFPKEDIVDERAFEKALEVMPKPCVVLISVPDQMHTDVMLSCIKNSSPFMIVKPAVTNLKDLYDVLLQLEKNPVLAMVDYHKVYDDANVMLKDEYKSGAYGKLQHFSSLMTQRRDMLEIYSKTLSSDNSPNINHYLGSHYIHMVGFITNAHPIDVRAIAQFGNAEKILSKDGIADLIQVQVRWKDNNNHIFTSYHVSGWSDPSETESMTYQEIQMLCENGHIDSDQRYRGFRKVISGEGYSAPNPYFFGLNKGPGNNSIDTKYGFISVKTFIDYCINILDGKLSLEDISNSIPTLNESDKVTAILEAADKSLVNNSKIIEISSENGKYFIM